VVDAIGKDDRFVNDLESELRIRGPMGSTDEEPIDRRHPMRQTAPGRYEARFPLDRYGSFVLSAVHKREGRTIARSMVQLANPYPREYATFEADEGLMREAAEATGGMRAPSVEAIFDPAGESIEAYEPLWPKLLFVALGLFVLDLLLRRVRLFDRHFRRSPARLGRARA
jgi:hypothetical protein